MLSKSETETIRAALRYWRDEIAAHDKSIAGPYLRDFSIDPLSSDAIATLIQRFERSNLRYVLVHREINKVVSKDLLSEHDLPIKSGALVPATVILH